MLTISSSFSLRKLPKRRVFNQSYVLFQIVPTVLRGNACLDALRRILRRRAPKNQAPTQSMGAISSSAQLGSFGSLFLIGAWAILAIWSLPPSLLALEGVPKNWKKMELSRMKNQVIDGDTLKIDLNQNGHFSKGEHIRLWYVDTPELSESHKGKDLTFGIPAKDFLTTTLKQSPVSLWIDSRHRYDRHRRTLGILEIQKRNINLELIRKGYSYFDTRFAFPPDFEIYIKAESQAFEQKMGIWSTSQSRNSYLNRLKSEGRTVYSKQNPWFVPRKRAAFKLLPPAFKNKFVIVVGTVIRVQNLRKGVQLIFLKHTYLKRGLPVVSFQKQRNRLGGLNVKRNDILEGEGFISFYKKKLWQLKLFRATIQSS